MTLLHKLTQNLSEITQHKCKLKETESEIEHLKSELEYMHIQNTKLQSEIKLNSQKIKDYNLKDINQAEM